MESLKRILISADIGCGLWVNGVGSDLSSKSLPFVALPELCARFEAWVDAYTGLALENAICGQVWLQHEQEGRALAVEIKRLAGFDYEVVYVPCRESSSEYQSRPKEVIEL